MSKKTHSADSNSKETEECIKAYSMNRKVGADVELFGDYDAYEAYDINKKKTSELMSLFERIQNKRYDFQEEKIIEMKNTGTDDPWDDDQDDKNKNKNNKNNKKTGDQIKIKDSRRSDPKTRKELEAKETI